MVSPTTRTQLQRVNDPAGLLVLLKLEHPAIDTVYVVNDTREWIINNQPWVGLPFRFRLPKSSIGEAPRAQIEVDNIGGHLSEELERLPPGGALRATFVLVSRATPTVEDFRFSAPLSGVSVTPALMTATVGNDDLWRAPAVKLRYDPSSSPGLFAG